MFIRRFLQTSILVQSKNFTIRLVFFKFFLEPLKSKLDRYESLLNEIGPIYKEIKVERLLNFDFIDKTGKIPSINVIKLKLKKCSNWDELKNLIPIFKEIRFLGSPKRSEISENLFKKLEEIYEKFPEDEILIKFLYEMISYEQLNPLIIPSEVPEETSDIYKTIIYTAKDLMRRVNKN